MSVWRNISIPMLAGAGLLVLANCGRPEHAADEKYFLVATNVKLPYWQSALAGLSRASGKLKVAAEMIGPDTYDPAAERTELQKLLQRKPTPTGILISPADPNAISPDIDAALRQGIPVITIDSDAASSKRILFIGTDNYKAGTMGGQLAAKLLQGKGNVAVFTMPGQLNLDQRLHGYQDVFATQPKIKITRVVDIKGDPRMAFDSAKEILGGKTKIDAFVCLEAIACPEIAEVVGRENQVGKVVIVAMDTDQRTLEGIQKGVIAATVGQKAFTMAYHGVMLLDLYHHHPLQPLIADWADDSFSPVPAFVDTGATLIDKGNVSQFLSQRQSSTQ
jgi:ribose transport system substrate-binding protein